MKCILDMEMYAIDKRNVFQIGNECMLYIKEMYDRYKKKCMLNIKEMFARYKMNDRYELSLYDLPGHSPKFETDYNVIGLRGVPFSHQDLYFFKELHPHIGNTFQSGSEHSVDGNFKPMEVSMHNAN